MQCGSLSLAVEKQLRHASEPFTFMNNFLLLLFLLRFTFKAQISKMKNRC